MRDLRVKFWRWALVFTLLAQVPCAWADDWTWSNPYGSVKLYGSGEIATTLATNATVGSNSGADSINYLDAIFPPAVSQTFVSANGSSLTATARLSVEDGEVGSLLSSGSIDFSAVGAGGAGGGAVQIFFLISLPAAADIFLQGIRSSVALDAGNGFSLSLFASDAVGTKVGGSLLTYTGNNFDQETAFRAGSGYYLLQLDATARATAGSATNATSFSFALDLTPTTAVPEPAATGLLVFGGILLVMGSRKEVRRRLRMLISIE